ncbi:MAG TPA: hypothetical protein VG713_08070, partial [Pirellulales bacterium]|nr:hypothetical protein [Pirellulales bacterium]
MAGHGCPYRHRLRRARWRACTALGLQCLAGLLALVASAAGADEPVALRVRIEWGGGVERQWKGWIAVSEGTIDEPKALGIEADEPGSMWLDDGQLVVASRSGRVYDGLDLLVTAPPSATLQVSLAHAETPEANPIAVPLSRVAEDLFNAALDGQGNRLLVRRAPGDKLRVRTQRDSLVFGVGENFDFEVQPSLPGVVSGTKMKLQARLVAAATGRIAWTDEREVIVADPPEAMPYEAFSATLPAEEGVYDLLLVASRRSLTERLTLRATTEERRVQVVVLGAQPVDAAQDESEAVAFEVLLEIDPANPRWWERFTNLPLLPGVRRGPLGNGETALWQHPLQPLVQLGPSGREPNIAWEAYPLPIGRPGQPHLLEVEYPSDVPQTLGISIVEPNAAGAVMPIGLDSGVHVAPEATKFFEPELLKHRLVFWPRTASPLVLMTNRQDGAKASYGKLRLIGPKPPARSTLSSLGRELPGLARELAPGSRDTLPAAHLPRGFQRGAPLSQRLCAVQFDRPLFPENFTVDQGVDAWSGHSGRTLDDWTTFYQGASRLIEYLVFAGYDAAMMAVVADGSAIYPSQYLDPTPRYDDGVFFTNGQDALRKDVLELLLRMFDREQLRFVPELQFTAPLPQLEAIRRHGGAESTGIELIAADGKTWLSHSTPRHQMAPYYNPLNPRVQEAMLDVVRELVARYQHHSSLAGLAVQLSADGYAQLPG